MTYRDVRGTVDHFVGHPLGLQLAWDLYEVKHSSAAKEIQKIKPLISKAS